MADMLVNQSSNQTNGSVEGKDNDLDNYEVNESMKLACDIYLFVTMTIVVGLLCIFGLFGNIVAFCVFRYDKMKTSSSFLFQALAIIDSVLLLASFPIFSVFQFHVFTGYLEGFQDVHSVLLVHLLPVAFIAQTATIWVTVLVGFNRFIAVCKPYKAPRLCTVNQARKQLAIVIACSVLYNVPRFFEARVMESEVNGTIQLVPNYTSFGENKHYLTIYHNICYMIFLLILPLLILTTLNIRLIRALKELKRKRQEMQSLRQQQDNNVTFVLIIVVIVFTICQFPALITQISWNVLDNSYRLCGGFQFYFSKISNILVLTNSSVNFVIYLLFNTRFRQILLQCCCRQEYQKVRTLTGSTMMTQTNNHNHLNASIKQPSNAAAPKENKTTDKCENGEGQQNTLL